MWTLNIRMRNSLVFKFNCVARLLDLYYWLLLGDTGGVLQSWLGQFDGIKTFAGRNSVRNYLGKRRPLGNVTFIHARVFVGRMSILLRENSLVNACTTRHTGPFLRISWRDILPTFYVKRPQHPPALNHFLMISRTFLPLQRSSLSDIS